MHLRADGVHYRESAGTGPVVLKVVPVTNTSFSGVTMDHFLSLAFPIPTIGYVVDISDTESITDKFRDTRYRGGVNVFVEY